MATCRDIIALAMRMARILPAGREPKAAEAADGLILLQGMYDAWVSGAMFGSMTDTIAIANATAVPGQRIRIDGAFTVTLPTVIEDGGAQLPPYDLSLVQIIRTASIETHLYEAMRGAWVRLDALTLDTVAPLSTRGADGLAALLAKRFAEMFGTELGPAFVRRAMQFNGSIIANIASDTPRLATEYY